MILGNAEYSCRVAGVDEAGRGPLAGPVVAAAVVLPKGYQNGEIKDSKVLSRVQRTQLARIIKNDAVSWAAVAVGPRRIEKINIREASRLAMKLAVERISAECVLIDGNVPIQCHVKQHTVVKGDSLYIEIAAASIVAKEMRDELMMTLAKRFPQYGFDSHMGYPTKIHREALRVHGPSKIHRKTFRGVSV